MLIVCYSFIKSTSNYFFDQLSNLLYYQLNLWMIFISFRKCKPGYLIEEFFHHDIELRVATIFGRVIVGASDCGLRITSTKIGPEWAKYVYAVLHYILCTMLLKLSKCEVKDCLCWNLIILPPLQFYVKSNFG